MQRQFLIMGLSVCALAWSAQADPFNIGGVDYTASGPTETLTASFVPATGTATVGMYSGLIQIEVSGTGFSLASRLNDAFYVFTGGPVFHDTLYYQLRYDDAPMVPFDPAKDAKNSLVYDIDAGVEVTPPYVPAYRADHTYTIVLDTGNVAATTLWFGVSNGLFTDNGGEYTVKVTQLAAVPEPCSLALLGTGALVLAVRRRRRQA